MTTSPELVSQFRSLAQKRKHGILTVACRPFTLELGAINGKVISVKKEGEQAAEALLHRLAGAGYFPKEEAQNFDFEDFSIDDLYETLIGEQYISEEIFNRAYEGYQKDLLYALADEPVVHAEFKPQVVSAPLHGALSLPATQLLLDFVSVSEEVSKYREIFGHDAVVRGVSRPEALVDRSQMALWNLLKNPISVPALQQRSLLPETVLRRILLGWLGTGNIAVSDSVASAEAEEASAPDYIEPQIRDDESFPPSDGLSDFTSSAHSERPAKVTVELTRQKVPPPKSITSLNFRLLSRESVTKSARVVTQIFLLCFILALAFYLQGLLSALMSLEPEPLVRGVDTLRHAGDAR